MFSVLPRFDFRLAHAVASEVGSRRSRQEDVALAAPELALFALADGMGGESAGDVAALRAIDAVRAELSSGPARRAVDAYAARAELAQRREIFARLRGAFLAANQAVRSAAAEDPARAGMGTTLDVVWLARDHAFVAHAGDGRVYLARSRAMLQITQDHTQAALDRAPGMPPPPLGASSGLVNAVGLRDTLGVDVAFLDLARGDRLLLCSDGVHAEVGSEGELSELLRAGTADEAARGLVARAARGGRDNATAVVLDVGERFVRRAHRDRGLDARDLERARQSALLAGLPEPVALSALSAAVEVELGAGQRVPRIVANDLVSYLVLEGIVRYPASGRQVGAGALLYPEALVGVPGTGEAAVLDETSRLLRLRADDFAEVCCEPRLAAELYRRIAQHFARGGGRG
ncbi:MAG TPA: protein phosphatase 2C domain-containing protein [Polyangiaceae bacterium]|nr:protein phosphatase 2C domain-containing protein [Polyangiaceae bacterium]